ncbi:MAG: helix-turn-helix domain-containing protein [Candidatus Limnocylindrales bacterium]
MSEARVKQVTDLAGLRALGHPLRLRLLGLLRTGGPATATALGDKVGAAPNAVSYHLRQLAKAGFIEPAEASGADRREHAWKASHEVTSWEPSGFGDSSESSAAADLLRRQIFDVYDQALESYLRGEPEEPAAWREAAGFGDLAFRASPGDLKAVLAEVNAVVARHQQRATAGQGNPDPDARTVLVVWHGFPLPANR